MPPSPPPLPGRRGALAQHSEVQLLDGRLPTIICLHLQCCKLHVVVWMVLSILCERWRNRPTGRWNDTVGRQIREIGRRRVGRWRGGRRQQRWQRLWRRLRRRRRRRRLGRRGWRRRRRFRIAQVVDGGWRAGGVVLRQDRGSKGSRSECLGGGGRKEGGAIREALAQYCPRPRLRCWPS